MVGPKIKQNIIYIFILIEGYGRTFINFKYESTAKGRREQTPIVRNERGGGVNPFPEPSLFFIGEKDSERSETEKYVNIKIYVN